MGITGVVRPVQDSTTVTTTSIAPSGPTRTTTSAPTFRGGGGGKTRFLPYGTTPYYQKITLKERTAFRKEAERQLAILKAEADRIASEILAKERKLASDKLAKELRIKRERELRELIRKVGQKRIRKLSSKQMREARIKFRSILSKRLLVKKKGVTRKTKKKKVLYTPEVRTTKKWTSLGKFKNLGRAKRIAKKVVLDTPALSLRIKKNGKIIKLTLRPGSKLFKKSKKEFGVLIERNQPKSRKKSITKKFKRSKVIRKRSKTKRTKTKRYKINYRKILNAKKHPKPTRKTKRRSSPAQLRALAKGRLKLMKMRNNNL